MEDRDNQKKRDDHLSIYKSLYLEKTTKKPDKPTPLFTKVLLVIIFAPMCIFLPFISLLFFLVWKSDKPKLSKWIEIGTYIGFAANFLFFILILLYSGLF